MYLCGEREYVTELGGNCLVSYAREDEHLCQKKKKSAI